MQPRIGDDLFGATLSGAAVEAGQFTRGAEGALVALPASCWSWAPLYRWAYEEAQRQVRSRVGGVRDLFANMN